MKLNKPKSYASRKKCRFCGRTRKPEEKGWNFVPLLLDNPRHGAIACPECYPGQIELLVEAGVLILSAAKAGK